DALQQVLVCVCVCVCVRTDSKGVCVCVCVCAQHRGRRVCVCVCVCVPTDSNNVCVCVCVCALHQDLPVCVCVCVCGKGRGPEVCVCVCVCDNVTVFGVCVCVCVCANSRLIAVCVCVCVCESGQFYSVCVCVCVCVYTGTVAVCVCVCVCVSSCDGLAGMIRMGGDEFFIEPWDQWSPGEQQQEEGGQKHIVYRSSAIIKKKSAVSQTETFNQTTKDFVRGPLLGSLNFTQTLVPPGSGSVRRRRSTMDEQFYIEVLLAVDYSLLLFHGRDHIQKYLLTLMNIVNEIYQDHSLGGNMNVVLVRIIMLSGTKSQELISVGNPQKSLENVCRWSYLQQREQSNAEQHDLTIYLTKQEFGPFGMQGYAPVTGMCQLHRSCVLVLEDGFSSAFVAAHETGHVLGMEHDGEANDCDEDVPLGSIMSPRVQATFYRYHWSRCSWRELHQYLNSYDCLRDDPFNHDWPAQPQLPGFQYSMDQQCRFDFGPGYSLCTAYTSPDPCKQLWCSDYSNPFFCKTKKSPPLDGTKCGPGKHCFRGFCMKLTLDFLRTHGSWGTWSSFDSCSRTCGGGVRFRTRKCDNPSPANGGRTCYGNSYEFQLCNQNPCSPLTDFREDQCKAWNPFFEHKGIKHHWLPYQHPDADERCHLYCQSKEMGDVVSMDRMVHDGTLCSYEDAHSVCVRGECEHVGCDGQIASDKQEDRCGVCGGDDSTCRIIKGNFTRSTKKPGYLKILEIPKGARHLLIQEFKGTPHILAIKNKETNHFFLNDEDELPESRVVIEKGVVWKYNRTGEQESVQTSGPLKYDALLMVRSHGDSKVTVSYKYIIQDGVQSSLESNLLEEDSVLYDWALRKWSHCSKPCGGGTQYTRFGCRRKADGKMVETMYCSNINKPRPISRKCNAEMCKSPRWVSGGWKACSASCGQTGWQRRWVSCQQESSSGKQQRSVNSRLCGEDRPESKQTCNRFPCPAGWRAGPWAPCSTSCGNGTQERQVACLHPEGSTGNCTDPQPIRTRVCQAPPCSGDQKNAITLWLSRSNSKFPASHTLSKQRCRGDRSVFCRMEVLSPYCSVAGYRQMCCKSCSERNFSSSDDFSNVSRPDVRAPGTDPSSSSSLDSRYAINDVIISLPPTVTPAPTDRSSTDLVYVEYQDYGEFLSYLDPSSLPPTPTPTTTPPRKTAPPHLFKKSASGMPLVAVSMATGNQTPATIRTSAIPDTVTSSPDNTAESLSTLAPPPKKHPSSVGEVQYQIVGVNSRSTKQQQNYFVPRRPPFHEQTHNKRIQQLLREKQSQSD
ncbi:A disintegrin and metalloproteinase with thrombospondin motifs 2-like, partial [Nothobranchius furzeri]